MGALERGSLGAHSRYVDAEVVYPDPASQPAAFVDAVETAAEAKEYFAVIPTRDDTTTAIARHKDHLDATGTLAGVEDWSRFRRVADKARTVALAADLSVPVPETWTPESPDAVAAIADEISYPVLVKPRSKHVADDQGRLYTHEISDRDYAHSPADLRSTYERLATADPGMRATPPLVQAVVDGDTATTVGVADDGELVATFQELRLRTTPHSGGSSTLIRGIHDDQMRAYADELVAELGWTGPIQVEFMRSQEDCYLIEINGRYWGRSRWRRPRASTSRGSTSACWRASGRQSTAAPTGASSSSDCCTAT
ncbi:carbamoyl phosphate synthase-like protein [Halolamina pelagica]|uniref:Carbamoyl phosphate synthase-like protein n=1 Tax=Halolamina pelagica TaxID=699431 RepID=A0A0P7HR95_9EURY|nr:ATP-grasp domain-containing protein [Halolamina pelagica]KPN29188.1 carbamoyl phosphate synthase-like protein [Halolamina pelagica]